VVERVLSVEKLPIRAVADEYNERVPRLFDSVTFAELVCDLKEVEVTFIEAVYAADDDSVARPI
jgi:hypothetical protein